MDYIAAAPEMTLLGLICVVMIVDLFVEQENRIVTFWLSMLSLAVLAIVLWATAPEVRTVVFYGAYVSDPLSQILKIGATLFVGFYVVNGGQEFINQSLLSTGFGPYGILVVMMIILVVLGMVLDWVGILLLAVPIFAPLEEA